MLVIVWCAMLRFAAGSLGLPDLVDLWCWDCVGVLLWFGGLADLGCLEVVLI